MDISIVIPVYNEADSLRELSAWLLKVMIKERYDYEVIMIDDGSSDDSLRVMKEISRKNPRFKVISFQRNYGKSAALQTGFQMARGNVVITMDADLQDSPDEIPELYKRIMSQGYDMISGWKKTRHDPIHKRLPSKFYNFTVRMVSGIKLHDFNCGLKAYKNELVKRIEVYGEMHRYIPVIAKWAGFKKIGEKVIKHYPRKFGKSKFGIERYAKGYLDLLTISFMSRYGRRPMHLFGLLGSFVFIVGFFIAGYLAYEKWVNNAYFMTSRPLFFFGLLAMILGTVLFVGGFLGELICRNSPDRNRYLIRNDIERYEKISKPNPHQQQQQQQQQQRNQQQQQQQQQQKNQQQQQQQQQQRNQQQQQQKNQQHQQQQQKPVEPPKPVEPQKPAEPQKPVEQQKPAKQKKQKEQQKPVEQKPVEPQKPAKQKKQKEQQKPAVEPQKPTEQQKPKQQRSTKQKKTAEQQPDNNTNAEQKSNKQRQRKKNTQNPNSNP